MCTTCRTNQPSACQSDGIPVGLSSQLNFLLSSVWKLASSWIQAAVATCFPSSFFTCHWCGPWPTATYSQKYRSSLFACHTSFNFLKMAASSKCMSCCSLQPRCYFPQLLFDKPLPKPLRPLWVTIQHAVAFKVALAPCPALPLMDDVAVYSGFKWKPTFSPTGRKECMNWHASMPIYIKGKCMW